MGSIKRRAALVAAVVALVAAIATTSVSASSSKAQAGGTYRVGWVGVNASTRIRRADLADFILTQVDDRQYLRQIPFVST